MSAELSTCRSQYCSYWCLMAACLLIQRILCHWAGFITYIYWKKPFSFSTTFFIVMAAKVIFRCKCLVLCLLNMLAVRLSVRGAGLCHAEMRPSSSGWIAWGVGRSVPIAGPSALSVEPRGFRERVQGV